MFVFCDLICRIYIYPYLSLSLSAYDVGSYEQEKGDSEGRVEKAG